MKRLLLLLVLPLQLCTQKNNKEEIVRWEKQAKDITIIRDNYGVPHIYGKTDAVCYMHNAKMIFKEWR